MGARLVLFCLFLCLNSVLFYKAVWGDSGLLAHREFKARQTAAEEECRKVDVMNMELSREIRLLQTDDAYIERMIRERLHYLRDNEVLYLFADENSENR